MSADDEVERLLQRTRATRERLNNRTAAIGETARPIRSPLREKNVSAFDAPSNRGRSPIKTTYSPSKTSLSSNPSGYSPSKVRSPIRTGTFRVQKTSEETPSTVTSYSRVYQDKGGNSRSEETFNKEATETKTTIIDGEPDQGNYIKTTITEREETIEKREVLQYTESMGSKSKPKSPSKILEEYRAKREKEFEKLPSSQTIKIDLSNKSDDKELGSPSRFGSCRDTSAVEEVFSSPVRRSRLDLSSSPSKSRGSPLAKFALDEKDSVVDKKKDEAGNEPEDYLSGRRRRLKNLACQFNDKDDDDRDSMKQILAQATATGSPYKRDLTKAVDVDKIINRSAAPSSATKNNDPDFVKSLKAQGFEETSSKSKLYYDFKKKTDSPQQQQQQHRESSPYRPDPMQYIRPQTQRSASPVKNSPAAKTPKPPAYRSVSPTRLASPQQRPPSPYKPHPLQFVSPQKAHAPPPAPPKPPRTYMDMEEEETSVSPVSEVYKTETVLEVKADEKEERTDTASRRSILEKRSMFEAPSPPKGDAPDPAMLPLSQRKALFEKNKSAAPKPIARFGESVTPAMLSKAQVPASEPAWKRRRDRSPEKQSFYTPAAPSNSRRFQQESETPAGFKKAGVDTKKNLFEQNWKSNDIAKATDEAKRKDMELLMNRFKKVSEDVEEEKRRRTPSPKKRESSPMKARSPSPVAIKKRSSPAKKSPEMHYPGVNSLKKIKVSPPRPGNLYPDLHDIHDERPETAMSEESSAPSEAPSLGTAIKRLANKRNSPMKVIAEDVPTTTDDDEEMECSGIDDELNDMLDEALDDSQTTSGGGPTPPKVARSVSPSSASTVSWEYQTPMTRKSSRDFKTPRVDAIADSPQAQLPQVETEEGSSKLMHTVSFYRKQKPAATSGNVTHLAKIVRNAAVEGTLAEEDEEDEENNFGEERIRTEIAQRINKLQEEVDEQMQRRAQASKALGICEAQNEFEGSYERVEFERLLLEAHHKHNAASKEIVRLKNIVAQGQLDTFHGKSKSKGTISLSGICLPLKKEFVKMLMNPGHGGDDYVHYFVCLVKCRSQVIATQMLSTLDGINTKTGYFEFPNLINIKDLDFDFQISLEVYGLQTPKEVLTHEAKYHIRKDKSLFNLGTPLKKLKKMESKFAMTPSSNPVNNFSIRKSKFGMVGDTTITIGALKSKTFKLDNVPRRSPLESSLFMRLNVHSESNVTTKGFLTYFTEVNGYGDWHRRWCVLRDNTLYFWKYPEDEQKRKAPIESESIPLHDCISETVTLAPRDICARMNTFMLENRRKFRSGDREALNMHVDQKHGFTTIRHLLMADTREERLHWCKVLNTALENLRAWDPTSMRPRSASVSSSEQDAVSNASTDIW